MATQRSILALVQAASDTDPVPRMGREAEKTRDGCWPSSAPPRFWLPPSS